MSEQEPWYRDGLAFQCTACGLCCGGAPGYVWVDDQEIALIANHLRMSMDEFRRRFVRQVGDYFSLIEYPDGDCIFLDPQTRKCSVYSVRPIQCRTWPFWSSNVETPQAWQATCDVCPGSGKGRVYSLEEIEVRCKEKEI